jgi:hypothetical protein
VDQLGAWMFNRRMNRELAAGRRLPDIAASVGQWYGASDHATRRPGKPEAWR